MTPPMEPVESSEAELAKGLQELEPRTRYAEVMAEATGGTGLRHDRTATTLQQLPRMRGAVYRAWDGAGWIEAATGDLSTAGVRKVVGTLARRLASPKGNDAPPGAPAEGRAESRPKARRPMSAFSLEDRVALAKAMFGWGTSVAGIQNTIVNLTNAHDERLFLSTVGTRRLQVVDRASATAAPVAMEGGRVEFDYAVHGGEGGAELLDALGEATVVAAAKQAKALLTAKAPPTGRTTVLLDPGTTGTFAHESFGHGTEADQLLRDRSYLKPLLGSEVGPDCLTIVDDGSRPGDFGSVAYDDEGFPSQRTVLVDRGRFVEVLHDRESAAAMGRRPTGNCRRADFLSRPFVRMTNTLVEPSDWSFEELVKEAGDGVLLESWVSGIEDPLGGQMQIKVRRGRRIEKGELTDQLSSMALSGRVLDFLRSIQGISRGAEMQIQPGFCGKGHTDMLPTGTGGAYLLARAIVGPA